MKLRGKKNCRRIRAGFTLAELLIVIAIIAVLIAVAVPVFSVSMERAQEAVCMSNRRSLLAEYTVRYMMDGLSGSASDSERSALFASLVSEYGDAARCPISQERYRLSEDPDPDHPQVLCVHHNAQEVYDKPILGSIDCNFGGPRDTGRNFWKDYSPTAENVVIPSLFEGKDGNLYKVVSIGQNAFEYNNFLVSVTLPNTALETGEYAFQNCRNLKTVNLSDQLTTISYSSFSKCESLASITLPDTLTTIGSSAFQGCKSLAQVTIPDNTSSIGYGAFMDCPSLQTITWRGTTYENLRQFQTEFNAYNHTDVRFVDYR